MLFLREMNHVPDYTQVTEQNCTEGVPPYYYDICTYLCTILSKSAVITLILKLSNRYYNTNPDNETYLWYKAVSPINKLSNYR